MKMKLNRNILKRCAVFNNERRVCACDISCWTVSLTLCTRHINRNALLQNTIQNENKNNTQEITFERTRMLCLGLYSWMGMNCCHKLLAFDNETSLLSKGNRFGWYVWTDFSDCLLSRNSAICRFHNTPINMYGVCTACVCLCLCLSPYYITSFIFKIIIEIINATSVLKWTAIEFIIKNT